MRNQWRLLLRSSHFRSHHKALNSTRSSPSQPQVYPSLSPPITPQISPFQPFFSFHRLFSSDPTTPKIRRDEGIIAICDVFAIANKSFDEIKQDLDSTNVNVSHNLILAVLRSLFESPDVAKRVFKWVLENDGEKLSSKSYNLMVGILGSNGFVEEFWEMVGVMKEKGYGVNVGTYDRVLKRFEEDGLSDDLKKLNEVFVSGSTDDSGKSLGSRIGKVIRKDVWGDEVEKRLKGLGIEFSSDLVAEVVAEVGIEQNKGLIFFRWVEESGLFKHDEKTYNAMARVLGEEGGTEKLWKFMDEMRNAGYEIERDTYVNLVKRFVKNKMLNSAVSLYEFAMSGKNKPSVQDSTSLLKKIVVGEELDIDLFAGVVKAFTESGNVLKDDTLDAVLKSLTSVDRIGECNKVLKVLQEGGYQPSVLMQSKIAHLLAKSRMAEEAGEFMNSITVSDEGPNPRLWAPLVLGYCEVGDVVNAAQSFKKMMEKNEFFRAGYVLDKLVESYCLKNKGKDAYKIISETIKEKQVHAKPRTFMTLIEELLAQGFLNDALDSLVLMKSLGHPPVIDPFISYLPKNGTADDAKAFLKAITANKSSIATFIQLFEAYFEAGKHSEAQDCLLGCPIYIKNNAEVLNLFFSKKSSSMQASSSVAA